MFRRINSRILFPLLFLSGSLTAAPSWFDTVAKGPSVLVLYDGPNVDSNPGRLDARYLANLLGHFTTRRKVASLEEYRGGDMADHDAVFCIVYEKKYRMPEAFLKDAAATPRTLCYLGNQVGQLDRVGLLRKHGIAFERFFENSPANKVLYKSHVLGKGDPDTNILRVDDSSRAQVVADALGPNGWSSPYIVHSDSLWIVVDSPFSYSSESDRYLAFADVLHDILGIDHPESHSAMLRIEDINPMSDPNQLAATLRAIRSNKIPFGFGFVPFYLNPTRHIYEQLGEKPEIVDALKDYIKGGGLPVLHGDTHQYRGVTTDDYEFWDDFADRPVKGDSEPFVTRRIDEALREAVAVGIFPLTWETPHYAASAVDYHVFKKIFNTVYERRLTSNKLGSDQYFPYPVIDLYGQYVIPESMGYVQEARQKPDEILANAQAALAVRDGYASFFYHPFLSPDLLNTLIRGIKKLGFQFVGLSEFPNRVLHKGYLATNQNGDYDLGGEGRFLTEIVLSQKGRSISEKTNEVPVKERVKLKVNLKDGQTYIAFRHSIKPQNFAEKVFRAAKGDFNALNQRLETLFSPHEFIEERHVILLWDDSAAGPAAIDQNSFESTLQSVGYEVKRVPVQHIDEDELGRFSLLVVPAAAAAKLAPKDIEAVYKAVEAGISLVTDRETPLSRMFGLDIGGKVRVTNLDNNLFPTQDLHWADAPSVPWIEHLSSDNDTVLYSERDEHRPLVVNRMVGEGKVLFFAPYFDEISGQGYSRFPQAPYIFVDEFRIRPMLRRSGAEAYFDPGYRQNISIEQLAKYWRRYGIRVIHIGAWHFYDKYAYDYERLVRVAHQNGILVYAWFEWPHVSQKFWNQHPEWREKTGMLADAHLDWRYLMNMQNPDCFNAVMADAKDLLTKLDWDGVNIAEFHYESGNPSDASRFTPLNPQVRQAFQKVGGFDPIELWKDGSPHSIKTSPEGLQSFYAFRRDTNQRQLKQILSELQGINKLPGKSLEFVVTMFDVFGHPDLSDRLGIDGPATVNLLNKHDVTLQVEDPASEWSKPPARYVGLGERYKKMDLKRPFMIDINVLDVHPPTQNGFATNTQSGTEILQLWRAASAHASRVCLYSESTISESDWELLPYAMAAQATVERDGEEWVVRSPNTVSLELSHPFKRVFLNERPWYCHANLSILIPPGEHRIALQPTLKTWFDTTQLDTRLVSLTGELIGSEPRRHGLEVEYRSESRCALMFNQPPLKTYIDGKSVKLAGSKGPDGYVILAPAGQHRLRVVSESAFMHFLHFTSVVSASLIVLFGATSSGMLFLMFVLIKLNRRMQPVRARLQRRMFRSPKKASS